MEGNSSDDNQHIRSNQHSDDHNNFTGFDSGCEEIVSQNSVLDLSNNQDEYYHRQQ